MEKIERIKKAVRELAIESSKAIIYKIKCIINTETVKSDDTQNIPEE